MFDVDVVFLDEESLYYEDCLNFELICGVNDLVYMIYMLGFIGNLKGVFIEYWGLVNYIEWVKEVYVNDEKINFFLYLFIFFDLMVMLIFILLVIGNIIIVFDGEDKSVVFLIIM